MLFKPYTAEQIALDIKNFEQVSVTVSACASTHTLYSDWAQDALDDDAPQEVFDAKVKTYLKECAMPVLDTPVDTSYRFSLYAADSTGEFKLIYQGDDRKHYTWHYDRVRTASNEFSKIFVCEDGEFARATISHLVTPHKGESPC